MEEIQRSHSPSGGLTLIVKFWHLIVLLVVQLAALAYSAGTLNAKVEQNTRDIQDIKSERYMPKQDFNDRIGEMQREIERLEGKIDAQSRLLK